MSQVIPRLLLFLCLPGLLLVMPVAAPGRDLGAVGAAPPEPMEMHLKIHREGQTEIPLRIYGKANEPLKYIIRVQPERGKLSEPKATEREVSVVVYDPPKDLSITTDKFYYQVQSSLGVSGAVMVAITIVDDPPKLAIADVIDFGKIRAGATASHILEISNKGGMIAKGQVVVDPPWRVEGKADYHLAADEVAVFKIVFEPKDGREYEGVARYTSGPAHSTTLRGVATAAISVDPPEWVLQPTPGEAERGGMFDLYNQLDEPRTLKLTTEGQLKIPAEINLAAHGKASVMVEAAPTNPQAWETEIRLIGKDFSIGVPVRVPALGPVIRLATPAISFGRLASSGKDAESNFEVENIGGTLGTVYWEVSPPFHATQTAAPLRPGEKKSFPLQLDTKTPGHYRAWVHFTAGVQTFDLPVQAEVAVDTKPGSAPKSSGPAPATGSTTAEHAAEPGSPAATPAFNKDLHLAFPADWYEPKPPADVHVRNITPTTAVIEWPASLSKATNFRAEMIQFSVGKDRLMHANWIHDNEDPINRLGDNYALSLLALNPNQPYTVRIVPVDAKGQVGERLFAVSFSTPHKPHAGTWLPSISYLQALLGILAGLVCWHLWNWWRGKLRVES